MPQIGVYRSDDRRTKAPSDEGAGTAQAVTGGEKSKNCNGFLSLRPFGAPPSSEGGRALPRQCDKLKFISLVR